MNIAEFDIKKYDEILSRGLSNGVGNPEGKMCIEAAVCATIGLPHSDDPKCVSPAVRQFKIRLNDAAWSSPSARAKGLRDLGIAQLGSLGVVDGVEFARRITKKTIQRILPPLLRSLKTQECDAAATRCETEGTADAANAAVMAANAAAARAAVRAANAAVMAANAADAAYVAKYANNDTYLLISAALALETLRELGSPGCALLEENEMSEQIKLMPCPCGAEATFRKWVAVSEELTGWGAIKCANEDCGWHVEARNEAAAAAMWNKREGVNVKADQTAREAFREKAFLAALTGFYAAHPFASKKKDVSDGFFREAFHNEALMSVTKSLAIYDRWQADKATAEVKTELVKCEECDCAKPIEDLNLDGYCENCTTRERASRRYQGDSRRHQGVEVRPA
jgi:hypothetical protein